jgi:nucleoside-diphosphate-sugar epimerase
VCSNSYLLSKPVLTNLPEKDINLSANASGPFQSTMEAYWASKALARLTSKTFLETQTPKFELINILPTVVIGPDNRPTCTTTADLLTTTSGYAMMPILGQKSTTPLFGTSVHVDDVAKAHIDALNSNVPGNAEYLLTSDGLEGVIWEDGMEITKKYFGGEVESGLLPLGGEMGTMRIRIDTRPTEKALGWKCRSFEETIKSLVGQYLELKRAE